MEEITYTEALLQEYKVGMGSFAQKSPDVASAFHAFTESCFKDGKLDLDAVCEVENFRATGTCITVDLKCFCGIQCVKDVFIDCDED